MKLTRTVLADLRTRCLRKRVWFRVLSSMERSLMDLTIRVVDEVRSSRLGRLLGAIVRRLEDALESNFLTRAWESGKELAGRFARIAYSWGYAKALGWANDRTYIFYLGSTAANTIGSGLL